MSSERLALVVALGVATCFATQDAPASRTAPPIVPITQSLVTPPVAMPPPQSQVKPHPVQPLEPRPAPFVAAPPPAPPPAQLSAMISLTTSVEQLTRRLADLSLEVERLSQWRESTEAASKLRASRPVRRASPDAGQLEPATGAPPLRKVKRPAEPLPLEMRSDGPQSQAPREPGDLLGVASVTDSLMKRIDRIEE